MSAQSTTSRYDAGPRSAHGPRDTAGRWGRFAAHPAVRWTAFGLVFLWGGYLAFWRLPDANINPDEPIYANAGWQYVHGVLTANLQHPPTAKYLMGIAQELFGRGIASSRLVSAAAVIGGAAVTFAWLRREIGWYPALTAAAMWLLVPRGAIRVDRYALLDPTMVFFMVCALACGWTWIRTERWWWIAAAGAFMALSATSKASTAIVVPAFVLLPILWRRWKALLVGGLVFLGAFVAVVVLVYLPIGVVHGVGYMLRFQGAHDARGHITTVAGMVTAFPPWWSALWYQYQATGALATAVLVLGVVGAVFARPWRLTVFIGTSVALLGVFYLGISNVVLPTYYYPWMWGLSVLAGIGIGGVFRGRRPMLRVIAGIVLAAVVVIGVRESAVTARIRPTGIARAHSFLVERGLSDHVIVQQIASTSAVPYFGSRHVARSGQTGPFDAVVVGTDRRHPISPNVLTMLEAERTRFTEYEFDGVEVFVPDGVIIRGGRWYSVVPK